MAYSIRAALRRAEISARAAEYRLDSVVEEFCRRCRRADGTPAAAQVEEIQERMEACVERAGALGDEIEEILQIAQRRRWGR